MNKLLTLCVATYNMEKYLDRCLSSVTSLEMSSLLEVIVVNDGSIDHSLEIAMKYKSLRPDIIKVIDKPNGNYGSCVNAALKVATGKYFRLLDADDWVDRQSLTSFMDIISSIDEDLIITNHSRHRLDSIIKITKPTSRSILYNKPYEVASFNVIANKCADLFCMHSMTYKLEILHKAKLKHHEGISYTDTEYCFYPIQYAKTLIFLDINLYQYDISRDGQTIAPKSILKSASHIETIANAMIEYESHQISHIPISLFFISAILRFYYKSILIDCPYVKDVNDRLKLFDKKIHTIGFCKVILRELTDKHIHFIRVWRFWGRNRVGKTALIAYSSVYTALSSIIGRFLTIVC